MFSHIFPEVFLDSITWKVLACAPLKSGELDQCHFIEHFFSLYELEGLPIYLYGWRISLGYQRDYRQLLKLKTVSAAQLIDNTLFSPHVQTNLWANTAYSTPGHIRLEVSHSACCFCGFVSQNMSDIQSDNIDMPHNDSYLCCIAFLCHFCVYFLHMMFWTDLIWQVFVSMKRLYFKRPKNSSLETFHALGFCSTVKRHRWCLSGEFKDQLGRRRLKINSGVPV